MALSPAVYTVTRYVRFHWMCDILDKSSRLVSSQHQHRVSCTRFHLLSVNTFDDRSTRQFKRYLYIEIETDTEANYNNYGAVRISLFSFFHYIVSYCISYNCVMDKLSDKNRARVTKMSDAPIVSKLIQSGIKPE